MRRFLLIVLIIAGACNVRAQKSKPEKISSVNAPVNIALEGTQKSFISSPEISLKSGVELKSDFQVEFVDFPENAKAAFYYVLSVYESIITSSVPITVQANWEELSENVLAKSTPSSFYKNFDGARLADVYYPVALVEKLSEKEVNGSEPDIICTFNSNVDWYLGVNGDCPSGQYDFVTVAIHEMVHGLGFSGFFGVSGGEGDLSNSLHLPSIYDWYIYQNNLQIADQDLFDMPSSELKSILESGELSVKGSDGADIEDIYAPGSFNSGTSIYHFNESGFSSGDANAIMTPFIFKGEAIHYPGDRTLEVLGALGWESVSFDGLEISDFEEAVAELPVELEISGELQIDKSSVSFNYSTDKFATSTEVQLTYNETTQKFEADVPFSDITGSVQYYYQASTSSGVVYTCPDNAPDEMYSFRIGADYYPPSLSHNPVSLVEGSNPVLDLTAIARDNVGIESVSIIYLINGVEQEPFVLSLQGSDRYTGELLLADELSSNDVVEYRVMAKDATQRGNTKYLPTSGYYTVSVFESAEPLRSYASSFDSDNEDFEKSNFEISAPDGFSGGTLHTTSPYPESSVESEKYNLIAQLKYPIIIEENGKLSFDEVVLVEPGEDGTIYTEDLFWDFVIVEGSKNNGKSWLPVTDGYDSGVDEAWASRFTNTLKSSVSEASATENLFLNQTINLTEDTQFEAGDTVLFRFRLASDEDVTGWGWAIDNLTIQSITTDAEEILADNEVSVYPNPFQSTIYVDGVDSKGEPLEVRVTDLYGKTVFRENRSGTFGSERIKIDLPHVASGVYLANITDNQSISIHQKIIKN